MDKTDTGKTRREEYLEELRKEISNPLHKRLIQAYRGEEPVESMEAELSKILLEVIHHEG